MSEKLVRNLIPMICDQNGDRREFRVADPDEMDALLRAKILEEADETAHAETRDDLVSELADLMEVARALAELNGISADEVESRRHFRAHTRGRFSQRLVMKNP